MPTDDERTRAIEHARAVGIDVDPETARVVYIDRVDTAFFERVERERGVDPREDEVYERFKRTMDVIAVADPDDLPDAFTILAVENSDESNTPADHGSESPHSEPTNDTRHTN